MVKGRKSRGGPPNKIWRRYIGFGNNFFFTLWRLMVNRKKFCLMINHNLFFSSNYKVILKEWWIKLFRKWLNLKSLWDSLIFLDDEHDQLFAGIIRLWGATVRILTSYLHKSQTKICLKGRKYFFRPYLNTFRGVWCLPDQLQKESWHKTDKL